MIFPPGKLMWTVEGSEEISFTWTGGMGLWFFPVALVTFCLPGSEDGGWGI